MQTETNTSELPITEPTLLVATSNRGKVGELTALLATTSFRVIGLADLPEPMPDVEETGITFAANALLKAEAYHRMTGLLSLSDDSGLVVDALDGRPGVYSARYGGAGRTSAEQIALLLDELKAVPAERRTARFVCCIAIVGDGINETFEGQCEGAITFAPRGTRGFGYDPVFLVPELDQTFAELTRAQKAAISHRGRALQAAHSFLAKLPEERDEKIEADYSHEQSAST